MIQLTHQQNENVQEALYYRMAANKVRMQNLSYKPILCLDFDGVLHSYSSGWLGARNIPDAPVEGSIEWLRELLHPEDKFAYPSPDFKVCIYSSRNKYLFGIYAMKKWLRKHGLTVSEINCISFPFFKPNAFLQIDDRAITFRGKFPSADKMLCFKPWYNS